MVYELTSAGKHEAKGAMHRVFDAIGFRPRSWLRAINIVGTWKDAPMIALLEYVYRKYQNYTVKSVIKDKIMRL
ncbi:hypothetical protein [Vulcanisaeta sp. JCM 16159]|uniref:hypothetical protein n=1 Tax=Vulcanisaeta sp. JCM 16159 TaxID=1295371 RepID=UPI0006D0DC83|nr:hypothetical protein [Vulcanisaeta sp. JCM 16159]